MSKNKHIHAVARRGGKPSPDDYRLYFVTDSRLNKGYTVLDQVALALEGGVRIIQIREKEMPQKDYTALISQALLLTRRYGAHLIVNDLPEVAALTGADGLHLGQGDMPLSEARRIVGNHAIIGLSVKTGEDAIKGERDGADYVAVNGVFPTSTKEDLGYCPGLDGVAEVCRSTRLPVIGIGGITRDNCRAVIEAGACGIAVVTAITMADHIPTACRTLIEIVTLARKASGVRAQDTKRIG